MNRRRFSTRALVSRLLEYEGRCAECKCKVGGAVGLDWDHIIPLAFGGIDGIDNLQPLCRPCHKAKTALDVGRIAKSNRVRARHLGAKQPRAILPGSRKSPFKRKVSGEVVRRTEE